MSHDGLIHPAFDDAPRAELKGIFHAGKWYVPFAELWALEERTKKRVAELEKEAAQQDEANEAQWKKFEGCPHAFGAGSEHVCGCSLDRPGDVCALHAPQLRAALAQLQQLREALIQITQEFADHNTTGMAMARAVLAATEEK